MISALIGAPGATMAGKLPLSSNLATGADVAALSLLPKGFPAALADLATSASAPGKAVRGEPMAALPNGTPAGSKAQFLALDATGQANIAGDGLALPAALKPPARDPSSARSEPLPAVRGHGQAMRIAGPDDPVGKDRAEALPAALLQEPVAVEAADPISVAPLNIPTSEGEPSPVEPLLDDAPSSPAEPPAGELPSEPLTPATPVVTVPPILAEPTRRNLGLAPGLARHDQQPATSPRGVEQRSARATERVSGTGATPQPPEGMAPPASPLTERGRPDWSPAPARAEVGAPASAAPLPGSVPTPAQLAPTAPVPAALGAVVPALTQAAPRAEPASAPADPPIPFATSHFAEDVGIALARRVAAGGSTQELVLRIEPADLGRIVIQLQFDERGALQAVLSADPPRVMEQLRHGAAELQRALVEAVGRSDVAPLRFEGRSDAGNSGNAASGFTGQHQAPGQGSGGGGQAQHRHLPFAPGHEIFGEMPPAFQRLATASSRLDLLA